MATHTISAELLDARNRIAAESDAVMDNIQRLASEHNFDAIPEFVTKFNVLEAQIGTMNQAIGIASALEDNA